MTMAQVTALDGQLQSYLDHLTIERGVAANTISSYRRDLRRYGEHLNLRGIHDLRDVTEIDVSEFLVALRKGDTDTGAMPLSAVSAARALIAVRGLHKFASAEGIIDLDAARAGLEVFDVDERGLDRVDRTILASLCNRGGDPIGLSMLAIMVGESPDTVEEVYEPFLIQMGFLRRTPRGRVATQAAWTHLGLDLPDRAASLLEALEDERSDGNRSLFD